MTPPTVTTLNPIKTAVGLGGSGCGGSGVTPPTVPTLDPIKIGAVGGLSKVSGEFRGDSTVAVTGSWW